MDLTLPLTFHFLQNYLQGCQYLKMALAVATTKATPTPTPAPTPTQAPPFLLEQ